MMEAQEVPVTICFNKTDLGEEDRQEEYRKTYEQAGYPVLFVSSREEAGVECIREVLRGKTTILAGPSGVGKSSLTNQILPKAVMETGSISEKIKRGKHTTRHAELFCVEENTYLCDTPGFSSMYLEDIESGALKYYFPEFEPFADACKFQADCVHIGEPVCGVKDALESGKLSESRYENYRILYQELREKERRRY